MESSSIHSVNGLVIELIEVVDRLIQAIKNERIDEVKSLEIHHRELLDLLKERSRLYPKEVDVAAKKRLHHYQLLNDQYIKELGMHYAVIHFDKEKNELSELIKE